MIQWAVLQELLRHVAGSDRGRRILCDDERLAPVLGTGYSVLALARIGARICTSIGTSVGSNTSPGRHQSWDYCSCPSGLVLVLAVRALDLAVALSTGASAGASASARASTSARTRARNRRPRLVLHAPTEACPRLCRQEVRETLAKTCFGDLLCGPASGNSR